MSNKIHYLSKNKIDDYINNNLNITKINKIYGDKTTCANPNFEKIREEHIINDLKFKNMNIYKIPYFKTKKLN